MNSLLLFLSKIVRSYLLYIFLLFPLLAGNLFAVEELFGNALNFQGLLVDEKGVPFGTDQEPAIFKMRFYVTSLEDGGTILWPLHLTDDSAEVFFEREVAVENGVFAVRIGKFTQDTDIIELDQNIFTGNDGEDKKRFLLMELFDVESNKWYPFSKKSVDETLLGNDVSAHIPVPGVPFIVSSVRVLGDDVKSGKLRLSHDPDALTTLDPNLTIYATGPFHGMKIIQNKNIALSIFQTSGDLKDAIVADGDAAIKGSVLIKGSARAELILHSDLLAETEDYGKLTLKDSNINSSLVLDAGDIQTPLIATQADQSGMCNQTSLNYQACVTQTLVLHGLKIQDHQDAANTFARVANLDSNGLTEVILDQDSDIKLSNQSFLHIGGVFPGALNITAQDKYVEALGLYDTSQPIDLKYPYQVIPHGLSIFNKIQFGESKILSFEKLFALIGQKQQIGALHDWQQSNNETYIDPETGLKLHRHDLRTGADSDEMINKLNQVKNDHLIKRRISDDLAYLDEQNIFVNQNHFSYAEDTSIFTNYSLITKSNSLNIFLAGVRASSNYIAVGARYPGLTNFKFVQCVAPNLDCEDDAPFLDFFGDNLTLSRDLNVNNPEQSALSVNGNLVLNATPYDSQAFKSNNFKKYRFHTGEYNPFFIANARYHVFKKSLNVTKNLSLTKSPFLNTKIILSSPNSTPTSVAAYKFNDAQNSAFFVDPSGLSVINSLSVSDTLVISDDAEGATLDNISNTIIKAALKVREHLTASMYLDLVDSTDPIQFRSLDNTFLLNPYHGNTQKQTKLNHLFVDNDLKFHKDLSVDRQVISSSLYSVAKNVFVSSSLYTNDKIIADRFMDQNSNSYFLDLNSTSDFFLLNLNNTLDIHGANGFSSNDSSKILSISRNITANNLDVLRRMTLKQFFDTNPDFYLDPDQQSNLNQLYLNSAQAGFSLVTKSVQIHNTLTVSNQMSFANTLSFSHSSLHNDSIEIKQGNAAGPSRFLVSKIGDITNATNLVLEEDFRLDSPLSTITISQGLYQNSTNGLNILSHTTIDEDVHLLSSSFEISNKQFTISTKGFIHSSGAMHYKDEIVASLYSLDSQIKKTNQLLIFSSNQPQLVLSNTILNTPLNAQFNNVNIKDQIVSQNRLITPIIHDKDSSYYQIDPNQVTRFNHLKIIKNASNTGGGLKVFGPMHFESILDSDRVTLSLDPSKFTTLQKIKLRKIQANDGVYIDSKQDNFVLHSYDSNASHTILTLENGSFSISANHTLFSTGHLDIDGRFQIDSTNGLVFTKPGASLASIKLTSNVLYKLVGKENQNADTLHEHSVIQGHLLTDILRRDVQNILSEKNTFIASGNNIMLWPDAASNNPLLVQKDPSGTNQVILYGDGRVQATKFTGDGTLLKQVTGADIINNSIEHYDFVTNTIDQTKIANQTLQSKHFKSYIVSQNKLFAQTVDASKIANNTLQSRHLVNSSLQNPHFKKNVLNQNHLARKSMISQKIQNQTLSAKKIAFLAIQNEKIIADSITNNKILTDQIRNYHIKDNAIYANKITNNSLITEDFSDDSVGFIEILTLAVDSFIINTGAITNIKINTSAITNTKIVSKTLLSQDFSNESIILDRVQPLSITSREFLDYTLQNKDFQNLSITKQKLASNSIARRHFQSSSISSTKLKTQNILQEHIKLYTIKSQEILDNSITNSDFRSNTINPQNLSANSILSIHIQTDAITRDKIALSGIAFSRIQPFAFHTATLASKIITNGHILDEQILSLHIKDQSIQTTDVATLTISGSKIQDLGLASTNIDNFSITTNNILANSILRDHFVTDSIRSQDIASQTFTSARIKDFNIDSTHLIDQTIITQNYQDNAAIAGKFFANSVDQTKIITLDLVHYNFDPQSITNIKIASETIQSLQIKDLDVLSEDIDESQVLSAHIQNDAISENKITTNTLLSKVFKSSTISSDKIHLETFVNINFATSSIDYDNIKDLHIDSRIIKDQSILAIDIASKQISSRAIHPTTITSRSIAMYQLSSRVLKDEQITNAKILANSIKTRSIKDRAIRSSLVANESISALDIKSNSIFAQHIKTNAITNSKLKSNIITTGNIIAKAILSSHLITSIVKNRMVSDNSIVSSKIASQTITKDNILVDTLLNSKLQLGIIKNRHIQSLQITNNEIFGDLTKSVFAQKSISGDVIKNLAITKSKIQSYSIGAIHVQSEAIVLAKVQDKAIINRHFEDEVVTTAKIKDQVIENDHLVDAIIQSIHVIDGSLKSEDVKVKSLPGTKFSSSSVESTNILSRNILSTHVANYTVYGDLFVDKSIDSSSLQTGFLNKDLLKAFTLSSDQVNANTITAAKLDSHFFLGGNIIANDAFDKDSITTGAIHPYHLQDSIDISKISSVSGVKFQDFAIGTSQIKDQTATGTQVLTETIGAVDFNIIYKADNHINKVSQDESASLTWQTPVADTNTTQFSLNASKDKFSFTSNTALVLAATDTGTVEKQVFDVASRFSGRRGHKVLTLGGKLYVIGGKDQGGTYLQDVWVSNDGLIFKRLTNSAGFGPRAFFGAAVFGGAMYVACGESSVGTYTNTIYKSSDGITWTLEATPANISARRLISLSVYGGKVYIIGGNNGTGRLNDVYFSNDFISFTKTEPVNMSDTETVLLIHSDTTNGNATFTDMSHNQMTVSRGGLITHSNGDQKFGNTSIYFDGIDDSLTLADNADFQFFGGASTEAFTIDFWVNFTDKDRDTSNSRTLLEYKISGGGTGQGHVRLKIKDNAGTLTLRVGGDEVTSITDVGDGTWHHIAIVRRSNDSVILFIDGTAEDNNLGDDPTSDDTDFSVNADGIIFGRRQPNASDGRYIGYMDEIRISKGIARWISDFPKPTKAYYTHFEPRAGHQTIAYTDDTANRLFLLGGQGDSADFNDLWYTNNGTQWYQSTFTPAYTPARYFDVLTFNDGGGEDLYVYGGYNGANLNQIYSWNGASGGNFTSLTPSSEFTARRLPSIAEFNSKVTIIGGYSDATNENDMLVSSDGHNFTLQPDFSTLEDQLISDTNEYEAIAMDLNDASYKLLAFDDTGDGVASLKTPNIEIKRFSRKDSSNYLAIDKDDNLIYSNSGDFTTPVTVISNAQSYKSPIFSPVANDYVYALKEVSPTNTKIVKIQWDGASTFGTETDLTPSITDEDLDLLSLSFSSDGKDLFFVGTFPSVGSVKMYKVSTSGSGLTTFASPSPKGSALVLDGEKYNPYISDYSIESLDIKDQSIFESRIALQTITAGDFVPGGLTEGSFTTGSLRNFNFETNSLTYDKWDTHSIDNIYLATGVITSIKLKNASLIDSLIQSFTLDDQTLSNNTFSTTHLLAATITHQKILENTFENAKLASDLVGADFALKSLHGKHFTNLSKDSIKDQSVTSSKYKSSIFFDTHFQVNQIKSTHLKTNSLLNSSFLSNQLEGDLIINGDISNDKIANNTILSANLKAASVKKENIKAATLLDRHFRSNAFENPNIDNDSVNQRTLALSSITHDKIAASSFNSNHFNQETISSAFIKTDEIQNSKMASKIFTSSNFASNSITNSDWIVDNTIQASDLAFDQITQDKLTDTLTQAHFNTASFDQSTFTAITANKIKDQSVKAEHFVTNEIATAKINNNALSYAKIADLSLQERHFQDDTILNSSFVSDSVSGVHVKSYTLLSNKIKDGEITTNKIKNNSLNTDKILNRSLESGNFDFDSVTKDKIQSFSLLSSNIAANTILTTHIINGVLTTSQIQAASLTAGVVATNTVQNQDLANTTLNLANFKEADLEEEDFKLDSFTIDPFKDSAFSGSHFAGSIANDKLLDGAITNSNVGSDLTSDQIANSTLSNREINDDAITGAKVIDGSFTGDRFNANTIVNSKIKSNTLTHADFADNAFTNAKFVTTASDFTAKTSSNAQITQDKIADDALQGTDLAQTIGEFHQRVFAAGIVTDAKLDASPSFRTAKVKNGEITAIKIADGALSNFTGAAIDANKFNSGSTGISAKIANDAATHAKFAANSVGEAQLTGTLIDAKVVDDTIEQDAFLDTSINKIEDGSITTVKILSSPFMTINNIPTISGADFEPVSGTQIQDNIFDNSYFENGYFTTDHLFEISGSSFASDSLTGGQIIDGELTAAQFDTGTITSDKIVDGAILESNIAAAGLILDNLKNKSIQNKHIADNTIVGVDFDASNTDGISNGGAIISTSIHQHSPFAYKRATKSGYTLIDPNTFGRTQFNYKIQAADELKDAQTTCSTDNAQVCDTYQLINICRSGGGTDLNDDFYFASNPYYNNVESKQYLTYPMVKLNKTDCFAPDDLEYDFMKSQFTPVKVTDLGGTIKDLHKIGNKYFVKIDNAIWESTKAWYEGGNIASGSSLESFAEIYENRNGHADYSAISFSNDRIRRYYIPTSVFTTSTGFTSIKDLTFFNKNTDSGGGLVIHNTDKVRNILNTGGITGNDISLDGKMTSVSADLVTSSNSFNGYHYSKGDDITWALAKTHCEAKTNRNMVSIHSQDQWTFIDGNYANSNAWVGYKDNGNADYDYLYTDGSPFDFYKWKDSNHPNSTSNQCARFNNSHLIEDKSCTGSETAFCMEPLQKFQKRYEHEAFVHGSDMYVIGGADGTNYFNDVWSSSDGATWAKKGYSTDPFLKLQINSNDLNGVTKIFDTSGRNHNLSNTNTVTHQTTTKNFNSSSLDFKSSNEYISIPDSADWNLLSNDFTIETWINPNTVSTTTNRYIFLHFQNASNNYQLTINDNLLLFKATSGGSEIVSFNTAAPPINTWTHIALVKSNNVYKIYYDGVLQTTHSDSSSIPDISGSIWLGYRVDGFIDNFRFSNGVARYVQSFPKPTRNIGHIFQKQSSHQSVSFAGNMWVFGGANAKGSNSEIWSSSDGQNWSFRGYGPWGKIKQHQVIEFNSKLWLIGGADKGVDFIWSSSDGVTWAQETLSGTSISKREEHRLVTHNDGSGEKLYILGGHNGTAYTNDVFRSSNGTAWSKIANAPWSIRNRHVALSYDDGDNARIIVTGGTNGSASNNEIWSSYDGITWYDHGTSSGYGVRRDMEAVVLNNLVYTIGGSIQNQATNNNEVHSSSFEKLSVRKLAERNYYSGKSKPNTYFVMSYSQNNGGDGYTHVRYYKSDATSVDKGKDFKIIDGDKGRNLLCPGEGACYVTDTGGGFHSIYANTSSAYDPTWTLNKNVSTLLGLNISTKSIIHMAATTASGAKTLYLLDTDGQVYSLGLNSDGKATATLTAMDMGQAITGGGTYSYGSGRITLVDGKDDEIIITGRANNIVIKRNQRTGKFACCTQGLE
ncbi:MAG: hypothetical protein KC646_17460 [Candidatus Cloacimonetes bacterium]|nr:hypothetical protein [Candidatus Cloacimonadota bacterium]